MLFSSLIRCKHSIHQLVIKHHLSNLFFLFKIGFEKESNPPHFSLALHEQLNFFKLVPEVESNVLLDKPAVDKALPVLHVIDLKNYSLEVDDDFAQLGGHVVAPKLMLLNDFQLTTVLKALTTLYARLKRDGDSLLQSGVDHVLQLFFGLDLLIENSKGDVFEVGENVLLIIYKYCLSLNVNQLVLLLVDVAFVYPH